jgi:hypothetical protein
MRSFFSATSSAFTLRDEAEADPLRLRAEPDFCISDLAPMD